MFIVLAGALAVITALVLILPFLRTRADTSRAAYDAEAYRAQLREVDQDLARGILTEPEAKAAKIEISRRLLAATDDADGEIAAPPTPSYLRTAIATAIAVGPPALAVLIYLAIGEAGRPDMPLEARTDLDAQMAQRPSQAQAETLLEQNDLAPLAAEADTPEARNFIARIDELEAFLLKNPDDVRGRRLLAGATASVGRYADSWRHYATLVESADEPDTELYGDLVETMVLAANGYVSPEAETATDAAIALDRSDPRFIHYKALALAQRGETEAAYARWSALLDSADPSTPWLPMVYRHARQAAEELGVTLSIRTAPGPSSEQVEAAGEMSDDDRRDMIEGMVSSLAARLAEDPDDLDGWLRLIRAYGVMGRDEDRATAIDMARTTFADDAAALARLDEAAQ